MDFGVVGFDGLMGSDNGFSSLASDPETKQKWYGAGFLKQQRSGTSEDDWRSSKLVKTDDYSASKAVLLHQKNALLRSNCTLFSDGQQQQQMLSFSSPKSEVLVEKNFQNAPLPNFHHALSAYSRNTGYSSGSLDGASAHGVLPGSRGPFTPSQWMELEHQALIYKYITANMPVPSNLLIPIRKALDSAGFSSFPGGLLRANTLGWSSFHLGFSNNTDPEPGRCRRTDGKKWRCSRDAVADQKYCERHMNRGRHRSRKPVEGQIGHAITGTTTPSTNSKLMPIASSPSASAAVVPSGGGAANGLTSAHQQLKNLQHDVSGPSVASTINRMFINKDNMGERMQDQPGLSMLSPSIDLKPKENSFMIQKQQISYEEPSRNVFGLVTSDSLLNPSHRSPSLVNCSSQEVSDGGTDSQQALRHFIDDWPKSQCDRSAISWPEIGMQPDRTQLSISIPLASPGFVSSSSSPTGEKLTLSPLRLSHELDSVRMGLGVGSVLNEPSPRQASWIPISWEASMGGPLGEVLHHSNGANDCKNPSALNLMTGGWDNGPPIGSSPTGVLQKTTFGSLSNSSAGSSPRAENHKTLEGASQCNDLLGSTLNSSSLPAV
ncbi:growth-regulating factor 6-like isoform X2 [Juglans microcarpa x Juglans regia]|uniref:growth-regulating factor 6-like isoform X2 n=1 Tax=Juglans microcarpa x Juglans regia TaxID=2249226 RepID=UPI001B7DAC35|nr:growth-regulating factor 6-like isoform X2 [Juglans microcarpa x Juglans regia]